VEYLYIAIAIVGAVVVGCIIFFKVVYERVTVYSMRRD
jgi:uncharacterized integral membrane protein